MYAFKCVNAKEKRDNDAQTHLKRYWEIESGNRKTHKIEANLGVKWDEINGRCLEVTLDACQFDVLLL